MNRRHAQSERSGDWLRVQLARLGFETRAEAAAYFGRSESTLTKHLNSEKIPQYLAQAAEDAVARHERESMSEDSIAKKLDALNGFACNIKDVHDLNALIRHARLLANAPALDAMIDQMLR